MLASKISIIYANIAENHHANYFTFYISTLLTDNIPVRLYVGVMIFVSCVISYMLRTNLSINILAMVQSAPNSTIHLPDLRPDDPVLKTNFTVIPTTTEINNATTRIHVSVLPDVSVLFGYFILLGCFDKKN